MAPPATVPVVLAFLPSGGQWVIITVIGLLLCGKRLPSVAAHAWESLFAGDVFTAICRIIAFLALAAFAICCMIAAVKLASDHRGAGWAALLAAALALGLVVVLTRSDDET
jgi:hypothetical protein